MARPTQISDDALLAALAARPGSTSSELADVLGIGQSTAAKRLAALEGADRALREPGGRVEGVRVPDRWAVHNAGHLEGAEAADREEPASGEAPAAEGGSGRLGRGALGTMVRDYLAARPGEDLGPTQVGKALGRSQGAVSNALARLESSGVVSLVSESPRRYRIVAGR
jgi:DNA-binding MarR family transcriptional regulator